MSRQATDIVTQARTWLGTPFHHQARLKHKGCDCLGLIMGVAKELDLRDAHGMPMVAHDEVHYSKQPNAAYLIARLTAVLTEISFHEKRAGDLALFTINDNPQHLAILTEWEGALGMIHCEASCARVVEHRLDAEWENRLVKVFRWQA